MVGGLWLLDRRISRSYVSATLFQLKEIMTHSHYITYQQPTGFGQTNLVHVMAFRCPTKSISVFQPDRSMIWAVGPELFMAWAETKYPPSGDQLRRNTCVVAVHCNIRRGDETFRSRNSEAQTRTSCLRKLVNAQLKCH